MDESNVFELAGIGIGPFNLGLAALCHTIGVKAIFFDKSAIFNWHPGILLNDARLQVPFFADLVTPVDPCNKFSYMSYLHASGRLFRFAIRDNHFIKRTDYNNYCKWVVDQLPRLHFNHTCEDVQYDKKRNCYKIDTNAGTYYARRIVLGIGSVAHKPGFAEQMTDACIIHSGEYLFNKTKLLRQNNITIVGSGQSAAEILYDLLQSSYAGKIDWFTKSDSFFPMDYSAFALEKTSMDYIDYFYSLPDHIKPSTFARQKNLYKGINENLLADIYALLDDGTEASVHLYPNCELTGIESGIGLTFMHTGYSKDFQQQTKSLILATGYKPAQPNFIDSIKHLINWDNAGRYKVNCNYAVDNRDTIFVQNAEAHSHGHNAADLGLGPYRNASILNSILGREQFRLERNIAFQHFGMYCKRDK